MRKRRKRKRESVMWQIVKAFFLLWLLAMVAAGLISIAMLEGFK